MTDDLSDLDAALALPATKADDLSDLDEALKEKAPQSSVGSIVEAPFVGFNRGLADVAGAPVDVINWTGKKAGLPMSNTPFGGSESIKKGLGLIGANPDDHPATGAAERILQGAGEGAASMIVPEATVAGAARAGVGALAPRAIEALEKGFGSSRTMPAALGNAAVGAGAGAAGEGAGEVADAYAPDSPLVRGVSRMAGTLAGGAAAAGTGVGLGIVGSKVGEGARKFVEPLTAAGQERIAAADLRAAAQNPYGTLNALEDASEIRAGGKRSDAALGEDIPGSKPTTFQLTGDMGLGSRERVAATADPTDFLNRRADQNAARVGALQSVQPTGAPEDVASFVRQQLAHIDAAGHEAMDQAGTIAQQRAAGIGGGEPPESVGARLRDNLAEAQQRAKSQERALWSAVDPDGTLALPSRPVTDAAATIRQSTPATARPPTGEEAAIFDTVSSLPSVVPFNDLTALRSRVSTAMRDELQQSGATPSYARLAQLRGGIEGAITNAVGHAAANQQGAVARGEMAPEDTFIARMIRERDAILAGKKSGQAVGTGTGGVEFGGPSVGPSAVRAESQGGTRLGTPEGTSGVQSQSLQPNFDQAAADRLAAATDATRTRAQTFNNGPVGQVLKSSGTADNFRLPNSSVPGALFKPGPGGNEVAQAYARAVQHEPDSLAVLHDAASESLRREAMNPDGMIDPRRFAAWQAKYADALRAMPDELQQHYRNAAAATESVQSAATARRAAVDAYQQGILGKLIWKDNPDDVVKTVGGIFGQKNAVQDMDRLAKTVAGNPDAKNGLRKAIADYMLGRFVSNTEAGTSGQTLMKSDAFQSFVNQNRGALQKVFTPEEVNLMTAIAGDLQRSNRSVQAVKLPGQSNTVQDLLAAKKFENKSGSILDKVWKGAVAGGEGGGTFGALAGAAGAVGSHVVGMIRGAGLQKANDLVREALLNPDLARALLSKAPISTDVGNAVTLQRALSRLSVFSADNGGRTDIPDAPPIPRASGGRAGEPTDAQKEAGNYRKTHISFQGLPIAVENEKGSERSGIAKDGRKWSVKMPAAYGYIKRTEGADGDHVDCYIGPSPKSETVYVIDQKDHETGKFDEHKCMLGFPSRLQAVETYNRGFSDGKGPKRIASVTEMSVPVFKNWLKDTETKRPCAAIMRADGGRVPTRDYPAKRATRLERQAMRELRNLGDDYMPLTKAPDATVAEALSIANSHH